MFFAESDYHFRNAHHCICLRLVNEAMSWRGRGHRERGRGQSSRGHGRGHKL